MHKNESFKDSKRILKNYEFLNELNYLFSLLCENGIPKVKQPSEKENPSFFHKNSNRETNR